MAPVLPDPIKKEEKKAPKKGTWKRVVWSIFFATLLIMAFFFLTVAGAVFAYHNQTQDKAVFGQKVMGFEIGGKTVSEIAGLLEKEVSEIKISFQVEGEDFVATPEEAGISFLTEETAKEIVAQRSKGEFYQPWFTSANSLLNYVWPQNQIASKEAHEVSYDLNREKLGTFVQGLSSQYDTESKNAGLVMKGTEVEVIPAIYGRKIMVNSIETQLSSALTNMKSLELSLDVEKVNPSILEADTQDSINKAKALFNLPVRYHYKDQAFVPEKGTVASWIVFNTTNENGKERLTPVFDAKKVYGYVHGLAGKINITAVNKKVTVKNGVEQIVEQEGKEGLAVDVDAAAFNTAKSLTAGNSVNMELPTRTVKFKTTINNLVVANWEKYITVDISEQRMCAYLAGGIQVECWSVTTGATSKGYNTPRGTFLIQRKSGAGGAPGAAGGGVCMPNPPSTKPLCGINYVSTFTPQGHAIHEAWWRSSFGGQDYKWNGSHGCVNATYNIAKWIYNWAPIGTPVIISD